MSYSATLHVLGSSSSAPVALLFGTLQFLLPSSFVVMYSSAMQQHLCKKLIREKGGCPSVLCSSIYYVSGGALLCWSGSHGNIAHLWVWLFWIRWICKILVRNPHPKSHFLRPSPFFLPPSLPHPIATQALRKKVLR